MTPGGSVKDEFILQIGNTYKPTNKTINWKTVVRGSDIK